ncbi:hypothetical protein [uncultured Pseudokineococcus sp.]|uniref:hypothetical protein n=1 Tax=uncultured Pseudokineococcus sp. TaxID=1642928 RepID=UPI00261FB8B4|nr:hypothetical protein [uncultured Pseudokineococcus sp.]
MDQGHERALQRLRAALVAALLLALAAGAHVLGGGDLPDPLLLALTGALVLAGASVLGRRRLRHRTLLPVLGLGQVLLHSAFAALAVPAQAQAPTQAASHGHGLVVPLGPGPVDAAVEAASTGMVLAHVLATLVTALAAVSADRAWAVAVAWLTRSFPALLVLLAGVVDGPAPSARRTRAVRTALPRAVVLSTRPRRGPPALAPAV